MDSETSSRSNAVWQTTKEPGLYKHRDSGRYYSRISEGGKRPFVALGTNLWTKALSKHKRRLAEIIERRARGAAPTELKTLGDCADKLLSQLELTSQSEATKRNYRIQIEILKANWVEGSFKNFNPAHVTFELLLALRKRLQTTKWEAPAGYKGTSGKRSGEGYSNSYVNQLLSRLSNIMAVARANGLCGHDPFESGIGIHGTIWLPLPKKKKDLPSLDQMKQVFETMGGITPGRAGINGPTAEEPNYLRWRLDRALDAAEHSQFLAYSGCRLEEANAVCWEDILPKDEDGLHWVRIRGTKTEAADRMIPVFEDLAKLLEKIKARREAEGLAATGKILRVKTSRNALATACEKVGVPRMGHHTLRHYFTTLALSKGIPPHIVADWIGHKDKGITLIKIYSHMIREQSASYAPRLSYAPQRTAQSSAE